MKIVALLPFRNEERFLRSFLSGVSPLVDQIIAMDDNSSDNGAAILRAGGATVLDWAKERPKCGWSELGIRQRLLELGREAGGTHFVILDADETFTAPFMKVGRTVLSRLEPGQRLLMQWLAMWKSVDHFREDHSVWSNNFKDFAFRDDPKNAYPEIWMHTPRTPGPFANKETALTLQPKHGAVFHFQFSNWDHFQIKQAWCRVSELIKTPDAAGSINGKYAITKEDPSAVVAAIPNEWKVGIEFPEMFYGNTLESNWRLQEIEGWFREHGLDFFNNLDIWHVPQIQMLAKKIRGEK